MIAGGPTIRYIVTILVAIGIQAPATDNLLRNGSFDNEVLGWVDPTDAFPTGLWAHRRPGESGAVKVINEGMIRTPLTTGKDTLINSISQCVRVEPGRRYELSARALAVRDQPVAGYGAVSIIWFSNTNCDLKKNGSGLVQTNYALSSAKLTALDDAWHELRLRDLAPPRGARAAEVSLDSAVTDFDRKGDFVVWFDDVVFRVAGAG